jgi:dienelactone hydrolase
MRAAIRFVKTNAATYGVDSTKIIAAGDSAGGFAAYQSAISNYEEPNGNNGLMGASSRPAGVLALWAPVTSKPWCLYNVAPQSTNIAAGNLDICAMVQGTADTVVPMAEMVALHSYLQANRGAQSSFYTGLCDQAQHNAFTRAPFEYPGSPNIPYLNYTKGYQEGFLEDAIGKVCMYFKWKLALGGL